MAAATTQVTVIWRDIFGSSGRVSFFLPGAVVDPNAAAIVAIVAAINAIVRPLAIEIELRVAGTGFTTPTNATFGTVEDKAIITALDDEGKAHTWRIPAPKPTDFDPTNKEDVNFADAAMTAWQASVAANAKGRGGSDIKTPVVGHRGMLSNLNKR